MKRLLYRSLLLLLIPLSITDCTSRNNSHNSTREAFNGVYYWKTVYSLDSTETAFLKRNSISRMYVRFFDVVHEGESVPNATIRFDSDVPDGVEIVPVVFITVPVIQGMTDENELANNIITRTLNMADYHELGPIQEIQFDCDWTASTKDAYYRLCNTAHKILSSRGILLSSTIRLHQLNQEEPPVDCGVLMVYNTGSIQLPKTHNSILDESDVKAYLRNGQIKYNLPLDIAFPVYGWGILFREGVYLGILHETDYSDTLRYSNEGDGYYKVLYAHEIEGHTVIPGDMIRLELPTAETIRKSKKMVTEAFPSKPQNIILYHLDSKSINHYSEDEINSFYSR